MNNMISNTLLKAGALLATWELYTRWRETQRVGEVGNTYWRKYFAGDGDLLERADRIRTSTTLRSTGATLHIDSYVQDDSFAPVVVFNHGGGSYGRLATKLAMSFYDRGYTVVTSDQKGQGFSSGPRGLATFGESVQNVVDVARWARLTFAGPLFMTGGSLGGALSYYGAAAGAPVEAISCLNLYDFTPGSPDAPEIFGSFRATLLKLYPLYRPLGWVRLPWKLLPFWSQVFDEREQDMMRLWRRDPIPLSYASTRYMHSLVNTTPAIPLEQNCVPVQVINQALDKMTPPGVTRRNFERLGGPKDYVEVPFGHYSFTDEMNRLVVDAADRWFKANMPAPVAPKQASVS
jgi:pimeloyl-ACP methyl ester carboxylesterase